MIRNGNYAIYEGNYYGFVYKNINICQLVSRGDQPKDLGFKPYPLDNSVYTKLELISNLEGIYRIQTKAKYRGYIFDVENEINHCLVLTTSSDAIGQALNMDIRGRGEYSLIISTREIEEIWEEVQTLSIEYFMQ